jgi:hypothetical protein
MTCYSAPPLTAERRHWLRLHVGALLASGLLALACTWFEFGPSIFAAPHPQKAQTTLRVGEARVTDAVRSSVRKPTSQESPAVGVARSRTTQRRSAAAVHSVTQGTYAADGFSLASLARSLLTSGAAKATGAAIVAPQSTQLPTIPALPELPDVVSTPPLQQVSVPTLQP